MSKFVVLKKRVNGRPLIIPEHSVIDTVKNDLDSEWYQSLFFYDEKHKTHVEETGTVKGITDVKTNKLFFDFDDKDNPNNAKADAQTLAKRLLNYGLNENSLQTFFSSNKGFHLQVETNSMFTPKEVATLCNKLAGDLTTFDKSLYDAAQIVRVPWTKNPKSGLYKIPVTLEQLNQDVVEIKKIAESTDNVTSEFEWTTATMPAKLLNEAREVPKVEPKKKKTEATLNFDMSTKPRHWKDYKWALLNAVGVKENERHEALMRIAATCRSMGYDQDQTEALCLSFDEKFQKATGKPPVEDLQNNILPTIFSENWNGGAYSYKNDIWLQTYCDKIGLKPEDASNEETITIDNAFDMFKDYACNIDDLTVKTGIDDLDKHLRMTIGMSVGIVAPPGAGKCLGIDTPVLMYDGTIKMVQNVKVGDLLMGDDSSPRKVLSTCTGVEQLYKIKQKNGDDYIVNESHILSLRGSAATKGPHTHDKIYDIELKDYLEKSKDFKKRVKGYKVPVEFETKKLDFDPYFIGLWIGDGTTSKAEITVNEKDTEILNYLKNYKDGNIETKFKNYSKGVINVSIVASKTINTFTRFLKNTDIINGKAIPKDYLTSSRSQRLSLAAGILDTDGHLDQRKNNFELTTTSEALAKDYLYLFRSLGFKTTLSCVKKKYNSFTKGKRYSGVVDAYVLYITGDNLNEIPTLLPRKQALAQNKQRYQDLTEIEVEKLEVGNYYGFEIDGNRRFLLGDFTVTHNTSISLSVLNNMSREGQQSIFFSYDMYHALVFQKLIQKHLKVTSDEIFERFKNNDVEFQQQVVDLLKEEYKNVEFCFKTGQTPQDIANTINNVEEKTGKKVRLIVVDYNELVISDISDATASSAYVAQKLREIATTHNVCVIVLMQPNKMAGNPSDEIDSYRNAKGSSAIAQSVSVMLGVSRPGYNPKRPYEDQFMTINCLKNRMGSLFSLDLGWAGATGDVYCLSDEQREFLKQIRESRKAEQESDNDWK